MSFNKLLSVALIIFLSGIAWLAKADDTEVYFGKSQPVNLLLVLDVSGSMAWTTEKCQFERGRPKASCYPSNGEKSRLDIMKEALELFLNDLPDNVKVGVLTYSSGKNIKLLHQVKGLNENNHKQVLLTTIKGLKADGGTLAAGAMFEAARYYRGEYGDLPSPITPGCGNASNIVFLTDGQPNSMDYGSYKYWSAIKKLTGKQCEKNKDGKDCTEQLAEFLSSQQQVAEVSPSFVKTHTIAFALEDSDAKQFLENVADKGNGLSFTADSTAGLVDAFKSSIQTDIEQSMLVTPSVPLSQSNRLNTSNELYLAMFQPSQNQLWPGNLKKYYIKGSKVVDKHGFDAVDDNGQFFATASSAWSQTDGHQLSLGGAAQSMELPRTVYSNILEKNLWTKKNRVEATNNKLTRSLLGLSDKVSDETLNKHIDWLYKGQVGFDDDGDGTADRLINRFGDPLHSKPVIVNYADRSLLFVGDNEGYLHAINPDDKSGKESWAFIPRQLLKNTATLYQNDALASVSSRVYGLDGDITVYHKDKNRNGKIDHGETAYLYVGMRRGGRNYYALDISDYAKPKLMFTITGDKATAEETVRGLSWDKIHYYEGLAQTWSKPLVGHIKWRGSEKLVMIFGGGYDAETQDNESLSAGTADKIGTNIFIADAVTGQMLWNAKQHAVNRGKGNLAELMTNSFAADISGGDLTGSGTIEHFYVADTGGQLFRFDVVANDKLASTKIYGAKLADIQGSGVVGNRRFYNRPDVSFVKLKGKTMAMIAIGSGYRAHPLNETIVDRFYVFFDKNIINGGVPEQPITELELFDVTDKISVTEPNTGLKKERYASIFDILSHKTRNNGWYLRLEPTEKVLADATTINYRVFFTTYSPASDPNSCSVSVGKNRLYALSILDGRPVFFRDESGSVPPGDVAELERSQELSYVGIAPELTVLFPSDADNQAGEAISLVGLETICSGQECDFLNQLHTVKWRELNKQELKQIRSGN